jgi:hypothetical protein
MVRVPTEAEIREALLARAARFCKLRGISPTTLGLKAVNDGSFLVDIANGRNFTVGRYERVRIFIEANWPNHTKDLT